MTMFTPPHPGSILKNEVLSKLGISVAEAATQLGIARETLSRIINGKAGISVEMAVKLEAWISGPTAEAWLRSQAEYDLYLERQKNKPAIEKLKGCFIEIDFSVIDKSAQVVNVDRAERNMLSSVGLQLKKARNEIAGLAMEEAANKLEISKTDLKRLESGLDIESISLVLIKKAAIFFDVSVDYLFGLNEDWELSEQARFQRETLRLMDEYRMKYFLDIASKQLKLENRIKLISESFLELVNLCTNVDAELEEFFRLNPILATNSSIKLLRLSKRATEVGEGYKKLLNRYMRIGKPMA